MPDHATSFVRARGFTLVELLLVVSVIAVLASIAIPPYSRYIAETRLLEVPVTASQAIDAVNEYYRFTGRFPKDNAAAGLPPPERMQGKVVKSVTVDDGVIGVAFLDRTEGDVVAHYYPAVNPDNAIFLPVWITGAQLDTVDGMVVHGLEKEDDNPAD